MTGNVFTRIILRIIPAAAIAAAFVVLMPAVGSYAFNGTIFQYRSLRLYAPELLAVDINKEVSETDRIHIRYFSSDTSVATVTKDGALMALNEGECTLTAILPDGTVDECYVTVVMRPEKFKQVALTFDDGPGYYAGELLDFLADRGIHVTFFMIGNQVPYYEESVKRMFEEGHEIGNHSYSHECLTTVKTSVIESEFDKCNKVIHDAIGVYPTVFRPPYGSRNDTVLSICDLPAILWSVDTLDWKYRDADYVADQVYSGASDGAIILVHEIHKTTIQGVKIAVDKLLDEGWEFVTVSEMLSRNGQLPEDSVVYGRMK